MVCHVVVWDQPWKKNVQIKKSTCSTIEPTRRPSTKAKRSLLGDEKPLEYSNQKIEELKHFLSMQLTSRSNSDHVKRVVEVLNSTTQVVSGTLTKATVRVADTTCLKGENRAPSECGISSQWARDAFSSVLEEPNYMTQLLKLIDPIDEFHAALLKDMEYHISSGHQICFVSILEQPWLNKKELTQSECHAVPSMNVGSPNVASSPVDCLYKCDPKLE